MDESELSKKLKEYYEKTADYISKGKLLISTWENELKVYSE